MDAVYCNETHWRRYHHLIWQCGPKGNKLPLNTIYQYQQFKGQRCFVIGGGPSLRGFAFNLLRNDYTIGINKIAYAFEPSMIYLTDAVLLDELQQLHKARGYKSVITLADHDNQHHDGCYYVRSAGSHGIPETLTDIYTGDHSGYGAVNLAIALGFNPIYLLGFDYCLLDGHAHVWDSWGEPRGYEKDYLPRFLREMISLQTLTDRAGISVVNLSERSALSCYPRARVEDIL
jgi:hypothetical protein